MSYYMADGTVVSQAAAGVGALPPQAAAGFGRPSSPKPRQLSLRSVKHRLPLRSVPVLCSRARSEGYLTARGAQECVRDYPSFIQRLQNPSSYEECKRAHTAGLVTDKHLCSCVHEFPGAGMQGLGVFGEETRSYQDGILGGDLSQALPYGQLMQPFRDGIFGMRPLGQVSGSSIDFGDEAVLKETKLMLRAVDPDSMPVSVVNSGGWGESSQAAYSAWADSVGKPEAMVQDVDGQVIPSAYGLYGLWLAGKRAIGEFGDGHASTYWPHITAWATGDGGPAGTVIPPPAAVLEQEEEPTAAAPSRMGMLAKVGIGAAVVGGAYLLLRRR